MPPLMDPLRHLSEKGKRPVPPGLTPLLLVVTPAPMGTPPVGPVRTGVPSTGAMQRITLLSDLATLRRDARACGNSAQMLDGTPFSAADFGSGVSSITNTVPGPLALNSSTYTPSLHNPIPTNKTDDIQGTTVFSVSHRILP